MGRTGAFFVCLSLGLAAAAGTIAWREHERIEAEAPLVEKAALLGSENDELRDALTAANRAALAAQNVVRRGEIERDVEQIRELHFKKPVVFESLDRARLRQTVAGKLSEQYSDQEIADMSTGYSAMGLLPPDFPLKQTYINLLGEQIAAFYDQHQHKLFMFQDASLENSQNRVILAHELTHALQDQNFGLLNLALEIKNDDDRAEAASALIEGDATLVMSQYELKDLSWSTLTDTLTYSATQSMVEIRKAPKYLRQMLVFPYLKGEQFCEAVYERGGFAALSEVYANPPASTAQILHPQKYFAETREDPIEVNLPDASFQGAQPLADNVLGEMGCRLLFGQAMPEEDAEKAASGWRGDRYLVYDKGREVVWMSLWGSPAGTAGAVVAIRRMCEHRFPGPVRVGVGGAVTGSATADGSAYGEVQVGANEVVFVLAPDEKSRQLLIDKFAHG